MHATAVMEGGGVGGGAMARRYFIYKVPPLGASCFLNNINVACGDGFPV